MSLGVAGSQAGYVGARQGVGRGRQLNNISPIIKVRPRYSRSLMACWETYHIQQIKGSHQRLVEKLAFCSRYPILHYLKHTEILLKSMSLGLQLLPHPQLDWRKTTLATLRSSVATAPSKKAWMPRWWAFHHPKQPPDLNVLADACWGHCHSDQALFLSSL